MADGNGTTGTPGRESFEDALARLADVVASLESGSLGLTASIDAYERGVVILKRLHEELASAEERVKVLVRIDDEGRPVLEDAAAERPAAAGEGGTADSAQPAGPRAAGRGGRGKSLRSRPLPGMDDGTGPP
jgi:exodeoxyribonuclease VII small subunit